MKRKFISLLLLVCVAFGTLVGFSGCDKNSSTEKIDYVAQTTLNMDSSSAKLELTLDHTKGDKNYTHIDGDTTHFEVPKEFDSTGKFKARYLGVDTPESTGDIEQWGKAASRWTKEKLETADSVVLESNADVWERDTNERYLAWVWYRTEGTDTYRLLNLELLQEGLAVSVSVEGGSPYDEACSKAALQAKNLQLKVYSDDIDPEFYNQEAIKTTLKDVYLDLDSFIGKRVSFECTVTAYADKGSIYVEDYVEADGRTYGLPIFYGLNKVSFDPLLAVGNRVRIVGEITNSETFGYQMSALKYNQLRPDDPENIKVISEGNLPHYMTPTVAEFNKDNYAYADTHLYSSLSFENLTVKSGKTHDSKELTLYCQDQDGNKLTVHTAALTKKDENGKTVAVSIDEFLGKKINVKGIVDTFYDDYQLNVYSYNNITVLAS